MLTFEMDTLKKKERKKYLDCIFAQELMGCHRILQNIARIDVLSNQGDKYTLLDHQNPENILDQTWKFFNIIC